MRKQNIAALILPFLLSLAGGEVVEEILITVNDEIITKMDMEEEFEAFEGQSLATWQKLPADYRQTIISNMITHFLIEQEVREKGASVSLLDVSNRIRSIAESREIESIDKLSRMLKAEGVSWDYFFKQQRRFLYQERLSRQLTAVREPSTREIHRYYEENKKAEFQITGKLPRVSVIFLKKEKGMTYDEILKLDASAKELSKSLRNKKVRFEDMAVKHSDDNASKNVGGDTGWKTKEEFYSQPELWEAIEDLEAGEVSDVISSPNGFYILKVTDIKTSGYLPLEKASLFIKQKLMAERQQKAMEEKIKDLMRRAIIHKSESLKKYYSIK